MKNIIKFILFATVLLYISCDKDYLNVSEELSGGLTSVDEVFDNPGYTKRWYANAMSGVPDYSEMVRAGWDAGGQTGLHNPWTGMTDEINTSYGGNRNYSTFLFNTSNVKFHRWGSLYKLIRQANIFLEKAKIISTSGIESENFEEIEYNEKIADIRFMRAYYHYLLLEQYGAIPILDRAYGISEDLDVARSSVDEVVNFIDAELEAVIPLLPQLPITSNDYKALPTKGVALALRGKLWMHAASPLLNGGFQEALVLKNSDGKKLFPAADATKWNKAAKYLKDFIDYSNSGNYELYKEYSGGVLDPDKSVYNVFQIYNNEIIWANPTSGVSWGMWGDRFERRATPRSEPNGIGSTAVVQELVDDFYMKDGLPINSTEFLNASPLYSEDGKSNYNGIQVSNMWINREPRFYNTVFFAGRKWHISNKPTYFHTGTANDRSGQYTPSGYLLYKRFNRKVHRAWPGVSKKWRPSIIFRLAEFYLLYAEALNEVEAGNSDILLYTNKVRERAGLPNLEALNAGIIGNQSMQREAIRRESRIELATEGQRYFDVRRWMIAETPQGRQAGDFHGMNMSGDETTFYERTKFQTRIFNTKQYLYPIPFNEMQKSNNLIQNPGW